MQPTRRELLAGMSASAVGIGALKTLYGAPASAQPVVRGYGPLVRDPAGLLDLPQGFSYTIMSRAGEPMSDGLLTPGAFDGMHAFAIPRDRGRVALVRNHEIRPDTTSGGAFPGNQLPPSIPRSKIFDFAGDGTPKLGGTTTMVWDLRARRLVRSHLSLAGTSTNCAGGPTPWGSWLTCEETVEKDPALVSKPHGWVFEVPSSQTGLVDPVPLKAMGRFVHEAAAVDPRTGIVYLSEDQQDSLFYRFLPASKGQLARGGRLQALALAEGPQRDLRNWEGAAIGVGGTVEARWIDLDNVEAPDADLKLRGFARGALRFARGEGLTIARSGGRSEVYLCATSGGPARLGQVWRYVPSRFEGQSGEAAEPGRLELFVETTSAARLKNCDNVTVAPWGGLVLCEDGASDQPQFLRGVTADGALFDLAANASSEFAGATFSPDGSVLFVNVQTPGISFAIEGPWRNLAA